VKKFSSDRAEKPMSLKAMVFTSDRRLTATFAKSVAEIPLDWIWLQEMPLAMNILGRERFDLLLTDCASQTGRTLIKATRNSEMNNSCTIFGVAHSTQEPRLLELGADIYLRRGLQSRSLSDRIRENLPLGKHNLRKSERYPVKVPLLVHCADDNIPATGLNLSTGGMMLEIGRQTSPYEVFTVDFVLPDRRKTMHVYARMVWQLPGSRAGIRFLGITDEVRHDLAEWAKRQANLQRS
jgi:hypothetical protein